MFEFNITKNRIIIIAIGASIVLVGALYFLFSGNIFFQKNSGFDSNGDGLPDSQATALGLNPKRTDTDSDGIFDVDEINITHTDPTKTDTDGDGLNDLSELRVGRNPNQAD
jgi:hypothetical protein